jgi:hypothetical protein
MAIAAATRYSNNLEQKDKMTRNNIKIFNKNNSLGIKKTNLSKKSLRESNDVQDSFNNSILEFEHDIEGGNYGDTKIAFRPARNSIDRSYNSVYNPQR